MRTLYSIFKWGFILASLYCVLIDKDIIGLWFGFAGMVFLSGSMMLDILKEKPNKRTLQLLRDLADLQNGAPLESYREEWEKTMDEVYTHLKEHEV